MKLSLGPSGRTVVHGQMKLARLLELPEREAEERARELERDELFRRLVGLGAIAAEGDARARLAARGPGLRALRDSGSGAAAAELLDGRGELARLISRVGQERFMECFLGDAPLSDGERADRCGISPDQAALLREAVDRLYVRAELAPAPEAAPSRVFSAVAGVSVEGGRPALAFFHRDIWKSRWRVDERRCRQIAASLSPRERRRMEALLKEVGFLERRKSTLLRVLEVLLQEQAEYLVSRDASQRRPLTQRALAGRVGADPSVISRLIANKSVELPWGFQAPLRVFVPSAKSLLRERLHALALSKPHLSDDQLRAELRRRHAARLSRRSIAQYRKELGLGGRGRRASSLS